MLRKTATQRTNADLYPISNTLHKLHTQKHNDFENNPHVTDLSSFSFFFFFQPFSASIMLSLHEG